MFNAALLPILLASYLFGVTPQRKGKAASPKTAISGVVTDRTGSVLAGAKVVLDGAEKRESLSATNGGYSFTGLKPGTYTLTVTFPNFPPQTFSYITLKAGTELPIDVALEGTAPSAAASEQPAQSQPEPPPQQPQSSRLFAPLTPVIPVLAAGQAQSGGSGTGTISGTVIDPQGAVVAGANLSLTGPANFKSEAVSGANGAYAFTLLAPGTYTLIITAPNFTQKVLSDINVTAGSALPLAVSLELPATTEQVNVESSNVGQVETETATLSGTSRRKWSASSSMAGTSRS
jgi:hypothetical protein